MIAREVIPELRNPLLVTAFAGWNDAGDAATDALDLLVKEWDATAFAEVDPEDFYDFQVNRPLVSLVDGVTRRLVWPTTRMMLTQPVPGRRDIVLLSGIEPNMRWRGFCAEIVAMAREIGVTDVVNLGALLSDSPHSRPVPVTASTSDSSAARRLGVEQSRYEGPTGIVGVLHDAFIKEGIPSVSLWAAVPHYVAQPPSPKATLALLRRLEDIHDLPVPYGDLHELARAWERGVDELAREDNEIGDYVRNLERQSDEVDLPEASGEAIAREFERYLRRRRTD